MYSTLSKRLELLNTVLLASMKDVEEFDSDSDDLCTSETEEIVVTKRSVGSNLASISGGDTMAYLEFTSSRLSADFARRAKRGRR